jgi:hypothetical protein
MHVNVDSLTASYICSPRNSLFLPNIFLSSKDQSTSTTLTMTERAAKRHKTAGENDAANRDSSPSTSNTSSRSEMGYSTPPSSSSPSASSHCTKYSHDDLVTLLVGPDEQKMVAFGHQLSKNSEFFKSALKKQWVEGQTRVIRLPDEDARIVEEYLDFVSGGVLPYTASEPGEEMAESVITTTSSSCTHLVSAYSTHPLETPRSRKPFASWISKTMKEDPGYLVRQP